MRAKKTILCMLCVLWVDLVTTPIAAYYRQKDVLPAIRTPGFRAPCPRSKLLTDRCGYTKQIEKTNVSLCRFFLFEFSWLARSFTFSPQKNPTPCLMMSNQPSNLAMPAVPSPTHSRYVKHANTWGTADIHL